MTSYLQKASKGQKIQHKQAKNSGKVSYYLEIAQILKNKLIKTTAKEKKKAERGRK